jgi:hypothetical protein
MPLSDYALTDSQIKAANEYERTRSVKAVAKLCGISYDAAKKRLAKVKKRAALAGYAPQFGLSGNLSPVERLKGRSILEDMRTGEKVLQWTKSSVTVEQQVAVLQEVCDELKAGIKPLQPSKQKRKTASDLLNLFVLTDAHFGMKAWSEETGADWDLDIAERTVLNAVQHLVSVSPDAHTALLAQLGDCLHFDGILPVTPSSGHILDADSRFAKVVRTVVRVLRNVISMLLESHKQVVVLMAAGNHDPASSVWLQELFIELFRNDKRLKMISSPLPYYVYQHREVMLGFHHGHKAKINTIANTFLGEFREIYGKTGQTYIHTGHFHSWSGKEFSGSIVEQHPTLAARDAYSSHGGWHSQRKMSVITYDSTAEISRFSYTVRQK